MFLGQAPDEIIGVKAAAGMSTFGNLLQMRNGAGAVPSMTEVGGQELCCPYTGDGSEQGVQIRIHRAA